MLNVRAERRDQICHPGGSGMLTVSQQHLCLQTVQCNSLRLATLAQAILLIKSNCRQGTSLSICNEHRNIVDTGIKVQIGFLSIFGERNVSLVQTASLIICNGSCLNITVITHSTFLSPNTVFLYKYFTCKHVTSRVLIKLVINPLAWRQSLCDYCCSVWSCFVWLVFNLQSWRNYVAIC